jgi:hypothetical protein
MNQTQSASIFDRLLRPVGNHMPLEFAQYLVDLRAAPDVQARVDELADKCNEGQLSAAERDEYDRYIQANFLIGALQRLAKRVLANGARP